LLTFLCLAFGFLDALLFLLCFCIFFFLEYGPLLLKDVNLAVADDFGEGVVRDSKKDRSTSFKLLMFFGFGTR